jgi:hypothetical protein
MTSTRSIGRGSASSTLTRRFPSVKDGSPVGSWRGAPPPEILPLPAEPGGVAEHLGPHVVRVDPAGKSFVPVGGWIPLE